MPESVYAATVALAGNPNVGKSTVFNALTHLHQHTGNWTGKTITCTSGTVRWKQQDICLVDLPGTYALQSHVAEEKITREFLQSNTADCIIVVVDATCLERNLIFVLQVLSITRRVVLCLNLMDEAAKKHIQIDVPKLHEQLNIPVIPCAAAKGKGLNELMLAAISVAQRADMDKNDCWPITSTPELVSQAEQIAKTVVSFGNTQPNRDRKIDQIVTSRRLGIPIMLMLLAIVLFITIVGANIPSEWLSQLLFSFTAPMDAALHYIGAPEWLCALLIDGVWKVLASVVSVMLPPMAIFFPLFTCLEDVGYLPRIAFNLDHLFCKARACGKQALTLCTGFGCNAAGVVGCRIIDSTRERMIAILTNTMVPCNGRFPAIISLITLFIVGTAQQSWKSSFLAALSLTAVIILSVCMTLIASWILSHTAFKGMPSAFFLELPPYRKPQFAKIIVRSLRDRTWFVLLRAVCVAAPAGAIIWLLGNLHWDGQSLLTVFAGGLDPFAQWIGLDGMILLAFILGFPANEIVIPLVLMGYLSAGSLVELNHLTDLAQLLNANGWTPVTAVCFILFSLFHWPCSTTCLTIHKETGSWKWTIFGMIFPTLFGIVLCFAVHMVATCGFAIG